MRIGLVAGEASGDVLGAGLIRAIRARVPEASFEGIAGREMAAAGCEQWEDAEALAVFGLVEPLRHVPRLLKLRKDLVRRWQANPPDVFVGIDAPDFNLVLEKSLRRSGIRTVQYVSPSIWVWRPGRIKTVVEAADRVLCILPFEKALYEGQDITAIFVGHPKADVIPADMDVFSVRRTLGISAARVVAVLPGSRSGEVKLLGSMLVTAAAILAKSFPDLSFVTPVATPKLRPMIERYIADAGVADRFTLLDGRSDEAMAAADVVLLASGTAALESALLGKPTVAAYKVATMTAWILRTFRMLNVKYFTLPNLLTESPMVREFIQEAVTPDSLAGAVKDFLENPERCAVIKRSFATLRAELALDANQRAADAVIELATL